MRVSRALKTLWTATALISASVTSASYAQSGAQDAGGGLAVSPVYLALSPEARSTSTIVSNAGAAPMTVQVRLFGWTTKEDQEVYEPTQDIGYSPALFRLAPGATQLVRLVRLRPVGETEGAYRLIVDQLPLESATSGVQMPVRMVLPVFAHPLHPKPATAADLHWTARYDAKTKALRLGVSNSGAVHRQLIDVGYSDGGAPHAIPNGHFGYALASQERAWTFPLDHAVARLSVTGQADGHDFRVDVPVAP